MNLYISDLDGTLLNNNAKLSDYTKSTLKELINKNLNFSIATARTPATVVPILSDLDLKLPVVVMNGAAIYDIEKNKYIKFNSISPEAIDKILSIFSENKISALSYTIYNNHINAYYDKINNHVEEKFIKHRSGSPYKTFINSKLPKNSNILYFLLLNKKDIVFNIYNQIKDIDGISAIAYKDVYNDGFYNLEIYSDKSSKANSIKEIMHTFNFDRLISFGDNLNDIPMFEISDECYAVKNAVQELKDLSTSVIDSNVNDGVANYLKSLNL